LPEKRDKKFHNTYPRFYRELFYLESEFNQKYKEPIFDKRFEIVNYVDTYGGPIGVEDFW
jgi:hypothetical protein